MIGRSGAGKSTILDWLEGFIKKQGLLDESCIEDFMSKRERTIDPPETLQHEFLLPSKLILAMEKVLDISDSIVPSLNPNGVLLHFWDFGGQLRLLEQFKKTVSKHIYKAADLLIWVIDSRRVNLLQESYREFVAFREMCPDARAVIFLNKWDFDNFHEDEFVLHMDERISVTDVTTLFGVDKANIFTTSVPRWSTLLRTFYELVVRLQEPPLESDMFYNPYIEESEVLVPQSHWPMDFKRLQTALGQVLEHTRMQRGSIVDIDSPIGTMTHEEMQSLKTLVRAMDEIDRILPQLPTSQPSPRLLYSPSSKGSLFIHQTLEKPRTITLSVDIEDPRLLPKTTLIEQFDSFSKSVERVMHDESNL